MSIPMATNLRAEGAGFDAAKWHAKGCASVAIRAALGLRLAAVPANVTETIIDALCHWRRTGIECPKSIVLPPRVFARLCLEMGATDPGVKIINIQGPEGLVEIFARDPRVGECSMEAHRREALAAVSERDTARADAMEAWRQRNEIAEQREQLLRASVPRGSLDEWRRRAEAAEAKIAESTKLATSAGAAFWKLAERVQVERGPGISGTHAPSTAHYVDPLDLLADDV